MLRRASRRQRLVQGNGARRLVGDAAGLGVGHLPVQERNADAGACCAVGLRDVGVDEEVAVFGCLWVFVVLG